MKESLRNDDFLINRYGALRFYLRVEADSHTEFCLKIAEDGSKEIVSWTKRPRPVWAAKQSGEVALPDWIYGAYTDVLRQCRRKATLLGHGAKLDEIAGNRWVDAAQQPGQVILGRAWSLISHSIPQYHVDLLWKAVFHRYWDRDTSLCLQIADAMMDMPWAFLSVLCRRYEVVRRSSQQLQLLKAARRHWQTLVALSPRYSEGGLGCKYLEEIPTIVQFSLARQGTRKADLRLPLTTDLLRRLATEVPGSKVRELAEQGLVTEAGAIIKQHSDDIVICSLAEHLVDFGYDDDACRIVQSIGAPDPHGIIEEWLAGRGNAERCVR